MTENLYNVNYHNIDLKNYSFLITGGAGFIGSNIVEYLIHHNAGMVRVLDNLSNGYLENIKEFLDLPNFEFINGDIRDFETCKKAVEGMHYISHQAALGSVPRSIKNPRSTNDVNISGFLNMLTAATDEGSVIRMVYAASSSTYGDSVKLPKKEEIIGNPLSPYAVTKLVNELYAEVFSKVYSFHTIGLRYFNVFGPKQNPDNPYAAVIPLFIKSAKENITPIIYGDGTTTRDFTFVENAVQANVRALFRNELNSHLVVNIAYGQNISMTELWQLISAQYHAIDVLPEYQAERAGDIKHSLADIGKATAILGYRPNFSVRAGIEWLCRLNRSTNAI